MFNMGPDLGTERELYNQQLEGILAVYFSTQSLYYFLWSMTGFETIKSTVAPCSIRGGDSSHEHDF